MDSRGSNPHGLVGPLRRPPWGDQRQWNDGDADVNDQGAQSPDIIGGWAGWRGYPVNFILLIKSQIDVGH